MNLHSVSVRASLFALLVTAFVALSVSSLHAHGGIYTGPPDAGAPVSGDGGGNAAPTNPGGSAGPGPGASARPGTGSSPSSKSGRRGDKRGGSDRPGSNTGGEFEYSASYETWEFWWEANKDRFLDLKERLNTTTNASGSFGVLTGRGVHTAAFSSRRPTADMIRRDVIPVLRGLLTETDRDIIDSAALAIARTADTDDSAMILQDLIPFLQHGEISVQTSTTLALGVYGSPDSAGFLREILADGTEGRNLVGGGAVPWLVRAFAALSIGLIGSPESVPSLIDVIENLSDADRDIKVCAIVGLSLLDEAGVDDAVAYLTGKLDDRRLDATIKSYIPTTLGKLGRREALEPLLASFRSRDTNGLVRQSVAIALGRLAGMQDDAVIEALTDYVREGKDMQTRHFAFISLAKIGARDEEPGIRAEAHAELLTLMSREITKPGRKTIRSWAGLAGAIYGREHASARPILIERIAAAHEQERDPSYRASFAVALGILNARSLAPRLFQDFEDSRDPELQGYTAVALGFLKHFEAAGSLRSRIKDKSTSPTFRLQCATGLGLMGDEQAIDVLIDALQAAETLGESSAVAKALGLIGDRDAIPPLNRLAQDSKKNDLTRAFAAVALGIVGERSDLPWNALVREDNNYRARVPAMDEVLDIL